MEQARKEQKGEGNGWKGIGRRDGETCSSHGRDEATHGRTTPPTSPSPRMDTMVMTDGHTPPPTSTDGQLHHGFDCHDWTGLPRKPLDTVPYRR